METDRVPLRNAARAALAKENHYALEPLARCTGRKSGR